MFTDSKKRYSIGELSKLTKFSISTLRYYDTQNLLVPEIRDSETGYRYYSRAQLEIAQIIRDAKSLGIPLKEIRKLITDKDSAVYKNCLRKQMSSIELEISRLQNQLTALNSAYVRLSDAESIFDIQSDADFNNESRCYPINISMEKSTWVISTEKKMLLDVSTPFHDRCLELQEIREKYDLYSHGPYMAIFHEGYEKQFSQEAGNLEVCLPILKPENCPCPQLKHFNSIYLANTLHFGNYTDISNTYERLINWIHANNCKITGPAREYYLTDPSTVFSPQRYITRVCFPIEKTVTKNDQLFT